MGTGLLESFSDGVLAVIITIMAFELKTPISSNVHALSHRLPLLLVYVLSFAFIGIYWVNHHHLLHATRLISAGVMWANLYLLFWLSLIPFVTAWVGAQHSASLPAACYAIVANGSGLAFRLLSSAIRRQIEAAARALGARQRGHTAGWAWFGTHANHLDDLQHELLLVLAQDSPRRADVKQKIAEPV